MIEGWRDFKEFVKVVESGKLEQDVREQYITRLELNAESIKEELDKLAEQSETHGRERIAQYDPLVEEILVLAENNVDIRGFAAKFRAKLAEIRKAPNLHFLPYDTRRLRQLTELPIITGIRLDDMLSRYKNGVVDAVISVARLEDVDTRLRRSAVQDWFDEHGTEFSGELRGNPAALNFYTQSRAGKSHLTAELEYQDTLDHYVDVVKDMLYLVPFGAEEQTIRSGILADAVRQGNPFRAVHRGKTDPKAAMNTLFVDAGYDGNTVYMRLTARLRNCGSPAAPFYMPVSEKMGLLEARFA
ncbi:MAG: hypothetical protein KJ601_02305 [Nanoarchaeota archaeon]|nr:hypothetical protein [Nanoarchaeota archaeon]